MSYSRFKSFESMILSILSATYLINAVIFCPPESKYTAFFAGVFFYFEDTAIVVWIILRNKTPRE